MIAGFWIRLFLAARLASFNKAGKFEAGRDR